MPPKQSVPLAPMPNEKPEGDYPTAKYRKDTSRPNGYECRRCEKPEDEQFFDSAIWKDSPTDL